MLTMITLAALTASETTEAPAQSHMWEILLTVVTALTVIVTAALAYVTQKLTNATLQVANIEMGKVATTAMDDMRDVSAERNAPSVHSDEKPQS